MEQQSIALDTREETPFAKRLSFGDTLQRHAPVIKAARYRLLRHTGNLIDGLALMVVAVAAALAHKLAGQMDLTPGWIAAVWWTAYICSWIVFVAATAHSLAFGLLLMAAYFIAAMSGLGSPHTSEQMLLLALVATASRSALVVWNILSPVLARLR